MINGSPTDPNAGQFKAGAQKVFEAESVKIAKEYDTPDWSPDQAQNEMEQAITALGKNGFAAVYAANDGTAGGAIAAMKAAGIEPASKPTTGQDAELEAIQRILAEEQFMTVYKAIKPEAYAAAEIAVALAQEEEVPSGLVNGKTNNEAEEVPSVLLEPVAVTNGKTSTKRSSQTNSGRPPKSARSPTRRPAKKPESNSPMAVGRGGPSSRPTPAVAEEGREHERERPDPLHARASARALARCRRWTASISTSTAARSSPWSATTAPASRR